MSTAVTTATAEMRRYTDERDEHKAKNWQQAILNMDVIIAGKLSNLESLTHEKLKRVDEMAQSNGTEIASLRTESDRRHIENGDRFDGLSSRFGMLEKSLAKYAGALALATVLIPFGIVALNHWWK